MENARVEAQHPDPGPREDLAEVLDRAAGGDESAWREVVDLFARRVYALAKSRCRKHDVAEEVTQSVFVTVATKLTAGEYTEQNRFESWLFRIAMNRIRDEMRRADRHAEPTDPASLGGRAAPSETRWSADMERIGRLRDAMEQLSDADREIVELRHHAGMSFRQVADLLNEPLGTLLARHHRALKKLKTILEGPAMPATTGAGE